MIARALAALFVLGSGVAVAEPVAFGARMLDIPPPEGFVATAKDVPAFLEISQGFLPPGNRLVDTYVDPADKAAFVPAELRAAAPRLQRYFQLQVPRRFDGARVSPEDFASGSAGFEARLEQSMDTMEAMVSGLTVRGSRELKDKTGKAMDLDVGEVRYLGVYRREPWGLFFTVASHLQVGGADGDASQSGPVLSAGAMALVNQQIVMLYAYARSHDEATRGATEASLSDWVDRVRAANPDDAELAHQVQKSGFDLASIGRGALIGGLCGALIGLFAWFRHRRGS